MTILLWFLIALVLLLLGIYLRFMRWPYTDIEGPRRHPLFGNFKQIVEADNNRSMHIALNKWNDEHGDIFSLAMPLGRLMVVVADPVAARTVLSSDEYGVNENFAEAFAAACKYGLIALDGGIWRRHRKLIQPAFNPLHLRNTVTVSNSVASELLAKWSKAAEAGRSIDVSADLRGVAIDVIGLVAFGTHFNSLHHERASDVQKVANGVESRVKFPKIIWPLLMRDTQDFGQARDNIRNTVRRVLDGRKDAKSVGSSATHGRERDLLDLLLDTQTEADGLSDEEIIDEVMMFFLAGSETTATTLSWMMYALWQHPAVIDKMRAEIDAVTRDGPLTPDSVGKLKYVEMAVKESLRIFPAAPVCGRMARRPQRLAGKLVPAGTAVIVNIMHMHNDERLWPEPSAFRPERFADDAPKAVPGAYLPFGDGPKNCIGQRLAMLEAKTVIARVVQAFDFELDPSRPVEQSTTVTMVPKNGLYMTLRPRSSS